MGSKDYPYLDGLANYVEQERQAWGIPGLALAITHGAEVVFAQGFGATSVEEGALPITPQTIFRIASTTKLLVGIAIMRLVEVGTLDLDLPIKRYIPELRLSQPEREQSVTLRQLLSHTSGLATFRGDYSSHETEGSLATFVRDYLPTYPFLTAPDCVWLYSNSGITLAAHVAEVVTDVPFRSLMAELVFAPLRMERTTFDPLVALTYPFAQAHLRGDDGAWQVEHHFTQNTVCDPAAGALSTVGDLAQVALMFLNDGEYEGRRILSPETIRLMQTLQVRMWTLRDEGYGLTLASEMYKGLQLLRHNGGGLASYASGFYLAPERGIGVILLANGGAAGKLLYNVLDRVFGLPAVEDQPPVGAPDPARWPEYVGTYLGPYTGVVTVAASDADTLTLTRNGKPFRLERIEGARYLGKAMEETDNERIGVGFVPGTTDAPAYVVVDDSPCAKIDASFDDAMPDDATLSTYAGTNLLPAGALLLPTLLTPTVTCDGGLLFFTWGGATHACTSLGAGRFACDAGLLDFHEIPDGMSLTLQETFVCPRQAESGIPGTHS